MTKSDINNIKTLHRIYLKPYTPLLCLIIILMVIVAATTSLYAYLIKHVLDQIFISNNVKMLTIIPIVLMGVTVLKNVTQYFQSTLMSVTIQKIANNMRISLYRKFMYQDIKVFNDKSSGTMASQVIYDVDGLANGVNLILTTMVRDVLTVVFLLGILFFQNPILTAISLIGVPLMILPLVHISRKLRKLSSGTQSTLDSFMSKMDDALKSPKLVKSYNAEEFEINRMNGILSQLLSFRKKSIRLSALSSPFNEILSSIGIAGVIWYGGHQVITGAATTGDFFSFFVAMTLAYKPLKSLSNINLTIQGFLISLKRFMTESSIDNEIKSNDDAIILPDSNNYEITFQNVDFEYNADRIALRGINFIAEPNQTIALVGPTGAGKSTITSLILRFYDSTGGRILINGIDIKKLNLTSLRSKIALVSQEVQLLDDTIEHNIKYCHTQASADDVIRAAKMANIHDFIDSLPEKYMTNIGQSGIKLSGGQRQRLSIARAILKNAPILILDEATSALDSISEKLIQDALDKFMQNRTTIVVAHRLSTIQKASKILVIEHGMITETGSHEELLLKDGHYAVLYNTQFRTEK